MKRIKIISIFLLSMLCTIGHAQVNGQLKIDKSEIRSERANEFDKLEVFIRNDESLFYCPWATIGL